MIKYSTQFVTEDDVKAVSDVLRSEFVTRGPVTKELEARLSEVCEKKYCVSCANGTLALWMAIEALGDMNVHTPTLTYSAVANAADLSGWVPLLHLYDVDVDTLCAEFPSGLDGTVVGMDYAGYPSLSKPLSIYAGRVVLDGAHSLGAKLDDGSASGKYADVVTLSFHPLKQLCAGEGGSVLTDDEGIYKELLRLRNNGIDETGMRVSVGLNCHMDEMSAALALSQLKRLHQSIERRHEIATYYYQAWQDDVRVILPTWANGHAFHLYPIRLSDAVNCDTTTFRKELLELGVGTQTHYYPLHLQPVMEHLKLKGLYPIAEHAYERLISIPMYYGLKDSEIGTVIESINKTLEKYSHG